MRLTAFACILAGCWTVAAAGVCDVRKFGAKGDGVTKDTAAIQTAIDAAESSGGGIVAAMAEADVVTWRLPDEVVSRDFCRVTADGRALDVFALPSLSSQFLPEELCHPYYAVFFDSEDETEMEVEFLGGGDLSQVRILPRSSGVAYASVGANKIRFRAKPPFNLVVESQGRHRALVLCANRPQRDVPSRDDPSVRWIPPGVHRENIELSSGTTLYLAPGAVLEGSIKAVGDGIRVCGRGIVSGIPWAWRKGPANHCWSFTGKSVSIRDVAFAGAWMWSVVIDRSEDVLVDGVRILGSKVLNDDGIDVCRSRNVTIRKAFIRTQDDCIAPKFWCENLMVEDCVLWTDRANAVRVGWECVPDEGRFGDLAFRNLDVLHLSMVKTPASAEWANCAIQVQASNGTRIENVLFDKVRFDDVETCDVLLNAANWACGPYAGTGCIDGLTLRDVSSREGAEKMAVRIASQNNTPVRHVVFERVACADRPELVNVTLPTMR